MRTWLLLVLLMMVVIVLYRQESSAPSLYRSDGRARDVARTGSSREVPDRMPEPTSATESGARVESDAREGTSLADMALAAMHSAQFPQPCLAGTAGTQKVSKLAIHRWVDAAGILHFSDQAPTGAAREHRRLEVDGLPTIAVNARGFDVNLPDFLSQRAVSDAQAIERVMRSALNVDGAPGLVLNIEFIASPET